MRSLVTCAMLFGCLLGTTASAAVLPPAAPNTWRIDETPETIGFDDGVLYSVTNQHATNSIIAFAVGYNSLFDSGYAFTSNTPGWFARSVDEEDWSDYELSDLEETPEALFGITWEEFQAFDSENPTTDAAVFYYDSPGNADPNILIAGVEAIGDITHPSALPLFGAVFAASASPAVVLMSGGELSGGPAGQANAFALTVPEPSTLVLLLLGMSAVRIQRRCPRR